MEEIYFNNLQSVDGDTSQFYMFYYNINPNLESLLYVRSRFRVFACLGTFQRILEILEKFG